MSIRRVVPDIASDNLEESRAFYTDILGFELAMDMSIGGGRIITLASPTNPTAQVTLVSAPTPTAHPHPNLTIEVADVDAVHARAVAAGLSVIYPLTSESWGVRRFFVADPNGVVINMMSHERLPAPEGVR